MTNDEKNKQALSTLSVFFRLKRKDNNKKKKEAEKRTGPRTFSSYVQYNRKQSNQLIFVR